MICSQECYEFLRILGLRIFKVQPSVKIRHPRGAHYYIKTASFQGPRGTFQGLFPGDYLGKSMQKDGKIHVQDAEESAVMPGLY